MSIIRSNPNFEFTEVANQTINDQRLSYHAMGIWIRLASKPHNWEISISGLMALYPKDRKDSVRTGLKELCKYRYLIREPGIKKQGRFQKTNMILYDQPIDSNILKDEEVDLIFSLQITQNYNEEIQTE